MLDGSVDSEGICASTKWTSGWDYPCNLSLRWRPNGFSTLVPSAAIFGVLAAEATKNEYIIPQLNVLHRRFHGPSQRTNDFLWQQTIFFRSIIRFYFYLFLTRQRFRFG